MRSHIAILKKPYLDLILNGSKRIECRLTKIPCPPFGCIGPDEAILLKQSGGPVRGRCRVDRVLFFENLTPETLQEKVIQQYNHQIIAADDFWLTRRHSRFCTLVWLKEIETIAPYRIKGRGLRAWITII